MDDNRIVAVGFLLCFAGVAVLLVPGVASAGLPALVATVLVIVAVGAGLVVAIGAATHSDTDELTLPVPERRPRYRNPGSAFGDRLDSVTLVGRRALSEEIEAVDDSALPREALATELRRLAVDVLSRTTGETRERASSSRPSASTGRATPRPESTGTAGQRRANSRQSSSRSHTGPASSSSSTPERPPTLPERPKYRHPGTARWRRWRLVLTCCRNWCPSAWRRLGERSGSHPSVGQNSGDSYGTDSWLPTLSPGHHQQTGQQSMTPSTHSILDSLPTRRLWCSRRWPTRTAWHCVAGSTHGVTLSPSSARPTPGARPSRARTQASRAGVDARRCARPGYRSRTGSQRR